MFYRWYAMQWSGNKCRAPLKFAQNPSWQHHRTILLDARKPDGNIERFITSYVNTSAEQRNPQFYAKHTNGWTLEQFLLATVQVANFFEESDAELLKMMAGSALALSAIRYLDKAVESEIFQYYDAKPELWALLLKNLKRYWDESPNSVYMSDKEDFFKIPIKDLIVVGSLLANSKFIPKVSHVPYVNAAENWKELSKDNSEGDEKDRFVKVTAFAALYSFVEETKILLNYCDVDTSDDKPILSVTDWEWAMVPTDTVRTLEEKLKERVKGHLVRITYTILGGFDSQIQWRPTSRLFTILQRHIAENNKARSSHPDFGISSSGTEQTQTDQEAENPDHVAPPEREDNRDPSTVPKRDTEVEEVDVKLEPKETLENLLRDLIKAAFRKGTF